MLEYVVKRMRDMVSDLQDEYVMELFEEIPMGKMLRSKLILQIAPKEESVDVCAIIELIHMASLLHDDVIDEADTRRGKASMNAKEGNKSAIMLGDILYSKAFYELSQLPQPLPKIISKAVASLSLGELLDVRLSKSFNTDIQKYLDMIYKKTASLIEASAISAAILANKDAKSYGVYGKNLGLAFQIVDDILDIVSDEKTLGKPALSDFKEGKTTLPYIYLYEALDEEGKEYLKSLFKKELSREERSWLMKAFEKTGALENSKQYAKELGEEALAQLHEDDAKLREIMTALIDRTY